MDGPWVTNNIEPQNYLSGQSIALATTFKAIAPTSLLPNMANYFNYVGKTCHIKWMGRSTSGATPGNIGIGVVYGPNTDNVGATLGSVQSGWTANQANYTWIVDFWCQCKAIGTSGSIVGAGVAFFQSSGIFPFNYNVTAPPITTIDTTASNYFSLQVYRSGSTAETIQMVDTFFESLN